MDCDVNRAKNVFLKNCEALGISVTRVVVAPVPGFGAYPLERSDPLECTDCSSRCVCVCVAVECVYCSHSLLSRACSLQSWLGRLPQCEMCTVE